MQKYFNILRKCSLFDNIEDKNLTALLGCLGATVKHYTKKDTVWSEGDAPTHIGLVLSGSVQISQIDFLGNRSIIADIQPSQMFGEAFACAEVKSIPLDVVANENCEIMFIDCSRAIHTCCNSCEFHSQIIYNLMKNMAQKNIIFHRKLQITSKRSTREKLMEYLTQQSKNTCSKAFDIPFDRQELADYLQVDRSGLSAEISKLRKEGIIKSNKNHFEIL